MGVDRICWNITNMCNDNCKFCFRDKTRNPLSLEKNLFIVNKLLEAGIKHIAFSGGEALLYPHLIELIKYIKEKGCQVTLISNCILLCKEKMEQLDGYIDWFAIPYDSIKNNGIYYRNKEHNVNVLRVLEHLENMRAVVKVNTVVSHLNADEILRIYDKVIQNYQCIRRWNLFEFTPLRGTSKVYANKYIITADDNEKVISQLSKINNLRENICIKYKHTNTLLNSYFVILPNGDVVREQGLQQEVVGNLVNDEFGILINRLNINTESFIKRTENKKIVII